MSGHATADAFFRAATEWKAELAQLRSILRSAGLEETVKWGGPVYTLNGKNVVGLGAFQSYFGLWFFQGALLADEKDVLVNAQEGKTKAMRQLRFRSADEMDRKLIASYVREAVGLAERGAAIKPARNRPLTVPAELRSALGRRARARAGFEKMTAGKRREYVEYIDAAKRAETKRRRIDKILPMIEAGIGLHDKYRKS